ncbi:hypothetical protein LSH36_341g04063, partial [Paralvinella palmiformis]
STNSYILYKAKPFAEQIPTSDTTSPASVRRTAHTQQIVRVCPVLYGSIRVCYSPILFRTVILLSVRVVSGRVQSRYFHTVTSLSYTVIYWTPMLPYHCLVQLAVLMEQLVVR